MEEKKEVCFTPMEALAYCQCKLNSLPITVEQVDTLGKPVKDVVAILEKLKQAIVSQSE